MARWTLLSLLGIIPASSASSGASTHITAWNHASRQPLLPRFSHGDHQPLTPTPAVSPLIVTRTALRLRHLLEKVVPCELNPDLVTRPHSTIITPIVISLAATAGGDEGKACVVFCLLICKQWFMKQAIIELWDADLHKLRAEAAEVIAKALIEKEVENGNMGYLLHGVLLQRYSMLVSSENDESTPLNVIEKAVDLHALRVICSSGYQKCINYLWNGWLVQDEEDPSRFVDYAAKADTRLLVHMDPDRMRVPAYQNAAQLIVSIVYLVLYTMAINSINPGGQLDMTEIALYVVTLGYVVDEAVKVWKAGYHIIGFWNTFNGMLYAILTVSFVLRLVGLSHRVDEESGAALREYYSTLSYNFLACSAPMFWSRLLLYLDSFRFFGAMLVVLKVMMKESLIFFALLIVVVVGFLQAFVGLDLADDLAADDVFFIVKAMANGVMGSPEYAGFDNFAPPFGLVLYYLFTFVVMVILLNILIALYGSAYSDIYENANDEYLALYAQKTLQFVRAPDENVYIAPLNLVEIAVAAVTEWWIDKPKFEQLNDVVMAVVYSPVLVVAAWLETRVAVNVIRNRAAGEADDDVVEEWEVMAGCVDLEGEGWTGQVAGAKSNVEEEPAVLEVKRLAREVAELKALIVALKEKEE